MHHQRLSLPLPVPLCLVCLVCLLPAMIVGCGAPRKTEPLAPEVTVPAEWRTEGGASGEVTIGWLDVLDDPALTGLVAEAMDRNRDLRAAAAGVDEAWALARKAGAALAPGLNAVAGASRAGTRKGSRSTLNVNLQASWEVDLWGRIRTGRDAATASAQAVTADYRHARHSMAAAVARSYFLSVEARLQQAAAADMVTALRKTVDIVVARHGAGLASGQDLTLARSDLAAARERLAAAQGGRRDAIRALELLIGRYPGAALEVRDSLPAPPPPPPVGLPAEILERRPDLVAAERRIAAAAGSLHQARVARLPSITLTASGGGASNALSNLLDPANLAWQTAANLLTPLFDGGARQAQVEAAAAVLERATAAYAKTALDAFSEVEAALDHSAVLAVRAATLAEALREAEESLRLAELRFREGEIDLLDVLTVRQRVIGARTRLIAVERERLTQYVNLNLALGGHWQLPAPAPANS